MEYLVRTDISLPPEMAEDERRSLVAAELDRGRELLSSGKMVRLWRTPGRWGAIAVYEVSGPQELHELVRSLPLWPWMDVTVESLVSHPLEQIPSDEKSSMELAGAWP